MEQNRDILKREIKKITEIAKNIINFTLVNKQIYVLRFCSKVVVFVNKITIRSFLGANFPFAPNSEHCTENGRVEALPSTPTHWSPWPGWPSCPHMALQHVMPCKMEMKKSNERLS